MAAALVSCAAPVSRAGDYGAAAATLTSDAVVEASPDLLPYLAGKRARAILAEPLARVIAATLPLESVAHRVLATGIDGRDAVAPGAASSLEPVLAGAGALILFKYNLGEGVAAASRLVTQRRALAAAEALRRLREANPLLGSLDLPALDSALDPFVAVDHEGGSVHRFGTDLTRLPSAAAFGALGVDAATAAFGAARRSGAELRTIGVDLDLAPVAEASGGGQPDFLGDRAYASDPAVTAAAAGATVRGMDASGVSCAVKHFPGDAATDPHVALPTLGDDPATLRRRILPFVRVFGSARPSFVVVSHAMIPALDALRPASLSAAIVTGLLKGESGFDGVAVADDLRMGAIAAAGFDVDEAAVAALNAGIDLLMTWPPDYRRLTGALVSAVADGSLAESRLRDAAAAVLRARIEAQIADRAAGATGDAGRGRGLGEFVALRRETEGFLMERGLR